MKKSLLLYSLLFFGVVSYGQNLDIPSFGTDSTFEIITWNIEWFPKNGQTTINYVSEIIQDLDVDIIAMQELDDTVVFKQMMANLDNFEGYFKSSWFAGLAYIYNPNEVVIDSIYEIYTTEPYWRPFPRSPMVMELSFMDEDYVIINNHFKCCGDEVMDTTDLWDEETRRRDASYLLEEYIRNEFQNERVILLGDLNDLLTDPPTHNVFNVYFENEEDYQFVDMDIAEGSNYNWSYPSWPSHLDHILITNDLFDDFSNFGSDIQTLRLDDFFDGGFSEYDANVSDHRPVALKIKTDAVLGAEELIFTKTQLSNFPNPFTNETTITFDAVSKNSKLEIFDLMGIQIESWQLANKQSALQWNAYDKPGGVYYVRLKSGNEISSVRKVILLK